MKNTAIQKKETEELVNNSELLEMLKGENGETGFEDFDSKSFALPFLLILQPLSPVVMSGIEGIRPGMIMDSVSGEVFEKIKVVPCAFKRSVLLWRRREEGGGFRGELNPVDVDLRRIDLEEDADGKTTYKGLQVADTRNHYVLYQTKEGGWAPALISMGSTQIKKSKKWNSLISMQKIMTKDGPVQLPVWGAVYELSIEKEKNEKGAWFGWSIKKLENVNDPSLIMEAKEFRKGVVQNAVKVDFEALDSQIPDDSGSASSAAVSAAKGEDIPF